jgi:FAD/FMN-containing dehydrogenase
VTALDLAAIRERDAILDAYPEGEWRTWGAEFVDRRVLLAEVDRLAAALAEAQEQVATVCEVLDGQEDDYGLVAASAIRKALFGGAS